MSILIRGVVRRIVRPGVIIGLAVLLYLVSAAWIKASKLWQWKAALLAQEFGHWFALGSLLLAVLAWRAFSGWQRHVLALLAASIAGVLMIPAIGAAQMTPGFNWVRLWMPWSGGAPGVIKERKVFGKQKADELDLIVYRPTATATLRPWVVVAHSGGWDGGTADEFSAWNTELASHGIVVLSISYRLAPKDQWPAQRDDARNAVEWARNHAGELGIDPAKLVMMGRSAGGQIASASAYGDPTVKAAGCILFYSPMDMNFARKYAYAEDILNSLLLLRQYLGGDPEQVPEAYRTSSAVNFINASTPPTLMIHGTRDSLVWVEQSRRLTRRLEAAGVPHRFMELPWATHGCDYFPSTPDGQLSMQAALGFIRGL